jgi:hypothetical protein
LVAKSNPETSKSVRIATLQPFSLESSDNLVAYSVRNPRVLSSAIPFLSAKGASTSATPSFSMISKSVPRFTEDRLICTFSEDWRYHARTIVGGNPSIISTSGIVEAPAKPREWYIKQMQLPTGDVDRVGDENDEILSFNEKEKYLDYGDYRINFAAVGYALQALFFFITEGNPFGNDINCRLYNAHWQEELIHSQIQSARLCNKHAELLRKFNAICC